MERTAIQTFAILTLLAMAGLVRADEIDPEPPGGTAKKLQGTWVSARRIVGGKESPHPVAITFTFKKDRAKYSYLKNEFDMKFVAEKRRPNAFAVVRDNTGSPTRYFYKIEKGELYLTIQRGNDPKAKPDFQGNTLPVIIYKKVEPK